MEIEQIIEVTSDGSHTIYVPQLNEHYHSVNGAIQESKHVFIEAGLKVCSKKRIHVLEFGFGTGLNAFLTCLEANKNQTEIHYTGIEKYPLDSELICQLNYSNLLSEEEAGIFQKIHTCQWENEEQITSYFKIKKIQSDFSDFSFTGPYDLVYYDAFAPDKQPSVWTDMIFEQIYKNMAEEGILTTYCAKGNIRRMMLHAGFDVERIPGPPGKRQMIRAFKRYPAN